MDVRVAVLVRLMVEVEVPLVASSAATKEAPAAKTVKRMFEICILKRYVLIGMVKGASYVLSRFDSIDPAESNFCFLWIRPVPRGWQFV